MHFISMQTMVNFKPAATHRQNAEPLSDILQLFVKANGLGPGLRRQAVFQAWDQASGQAGYISNKYLKDNVLYVTVSSSVVRSQLMFQKECLLQRINEILSEDELLKSIGETFRIEAIKMR